MVDLCVNELLVLNIDQWSEEEGASTEEGQAPKRNDLDEVVGDEGRSECLIVELGSVTKAGKEKYEMRMLTAIVTIGFSANKMRWNSITKKLISCSRSSSEASRASFGIL